MFEAITAVMLAVCSDVQDCIIILCNSSVTKLESLLPVTDSLTEAGLYTGMILCAVEWSSTGNVNTRRVFYYIAGRRVLCHDSVTQM